MTMEIASMSPWGAGGVEMLMDGGIKSTVVLCAAVVVSLWLRRSSAAIRHVVWVAALGSLLILPVFSLVLPGWEIVPAWALPRVGGSTQVEVGRAAGVAPAVGFVAQGERDHVAADARGGSARGFAGPGAGEVARGGVGAVGWRGVVLGIWATGVAVSFGRTTAGLFFAGRCRRRSVPVAGDGWVRSVARARDVLGVRRGVMVRQSSDCAVPLTFGIFLPTVLVSDAAGQWPEEKRQIVLLHELAHVKRFDCLVILLTGVVRSLYWFQPLAWLGASRIRAECERACDDIVLKAGAKSSVYARTLLEYATLEGFSVPAGALAMARVSSLERRVVAILNPATGRRGVHRKTLMVVGAAVVLGTALLASVHAQTLRGSPVVKQRGEFSADAADTVVDGLRALGYSFLTEERLAAIRGEFEGVVKGALDPGRVPEAGRREAILESLQRRIAELPQPTSDFNINRGYLGVPDTVRTLEFLVVQAIRPAVLSDAEVRRREAQREHMRDVIRAAPAGAGGITSDSVLKDFDALCGEPFAYFMQTAMSDEQFEGFKKRLGERPQELTTVVSQIAAAAFFQQVTLKGNDYLKENPLKDPVISLGIGGKDLNLSFASNRDFVGTTRSLADVSHGEAFDIGRLVPFRGGTPGMREAFHFDSGAGQLVGAAGTRFLALPATNWVDADGISSEELRRDLASKGGAVFDVSIVAVRQKATHSEADVFVAVVDARHELMVMQIPSIGHEDIVLRVRGRAAAVPAAATRAK